MFNKTMDKCAVSIPICSATLLCISAAGCKKGEQEAAVPSPAKVTIQNSGSDSMVVLGQAWAEQYAEIKPSVSMEVSGGGSGAGIAALINGTAEIANSTRPMTQQEIGMAEDNTGKEIQESVDGQSLPSSGPLHFGHEQRRHSTISTTRTI